MHPGEPIDYDSPHALQQVFHALNIAPRKFFGQNFLINRGVREKIVHTLNLNPEDTLWEIGPGLGAMTAMVMNKVRHLTVFEVDYAYQQILQNFFGQYAGFSLVPGDVLKTFKEQKITVPVKILGNLPYNIAAAIIREFLFQPIDIAVLMVQKELAQRMMSGISQKSYSSFSVWAQCHFTLHNHGIVKSHSFYPAPHVDSVIISLKPLAHMTPQKTAVLDAILRAAFGSRRKTLKNNFIQAAGTRLQHIPLPLLEQACIQAGINLQKRAEEYAPQAYLDCLDALVSSGVLSGKFSKDSSCSAQDAIGV